MAILDPALPRRSPTRRAVAVLRGDGHRLDRLARRRAASRESGRGGRARPSVGRLRRRRHRRQRRRRHRRRHPRRRRARRGLRWCRRRCRRSSARLCQRRRLRPLVPPVSRRPSWMSIIAAISDAVDFAFAQQLPHSVTAQDRRRRSSRAARLTADPKIAAALTAALKDEDDDVRQQALHTLVRMRAPIPPDVIRSMLKDKSSDVRQQAVYALGRQRDPKYVSAAHRGTQGRGRRRSAAGRVRARTDARRPRS